MNWNFLISFAVGLGVYLFVLFVVAMIKRHRNKNKFLKEIEHKEEFEDKNDEQKM